MLSKYIPPMLIDMNIIDEPYNESEINTLSKRLDDFMGEVIDKTGLVDKEIENLKKEMDFLKSQLKTQSKDNFRHILYNSIVTIIINYVSDPAKIKTILALAAKIITGDANPIDPKLLT
jgi:hypothetical protein